MWDILQRGKSLVSFLLKPPRPQNGKKLSFSKELENSDRGHSTGRMEGNWELRRMRAAGSDDGVRGPREGLGRLLNIKRFIFSC